MVGEKVIENKLNKTIKLIIYEDTINNIDKYGKETITTNSDTGQSYSSTSFKTTIYYGKDRFLQVDSDVPVNYGWTIKALYLKLDDSEEKLLCYKIIESNQYYVCEDVDKLIAKEYGLHAYAAPVFLFTLGLLVLDCFLFHTGHWFWGIIFSMGTFVIPVCVFWQYKCPKEFDEILSFIYKAMHQLRDKGKQLSK